MVVPKIGMMLTPTTMARAVIGRLIQLRADGFDFDLIDAHYLYPDGVAAACVARRFARPLVVTARGTDVNTIAGMGMPGSQIRRAMARAGRVVTVSESLRTTLTGRGIAPARIKTLRNGVDLALFAPGSSRNTVRHDLGIAERTLWLCVGHFTLNKGVHIVLEALAQVADAVLLIIGDGPERRALVDQARSLGVTNRV